MGAVRGVFTAIERMGQTNGGHGGRIINVASAAGITVDTYIIYIPPSSDLILEDDVTNKMYVKSDPEKIHSSNQEALSQ